MAVSRINDVAESLVKKTGSFKNRKEKSDGCDYGATTRKRDFNRSSTGEADIHMTIDSTNSGCFFCSKLETKIDKPH